MSRVLGVDPGRARLGLAVSDEEGSMALGRGVLQRTGGRKDLERLAALVEAEAVELVVVGLPLRLDGSAGPAAREAEEFAARLARILSCPVVTHDERLTTVEAKRRLSQAGLRGKKQRARVDEEAARLLLQAFLDARRARSEGRGS